jgi:hypothetical protein
MGRGPSKKNDILSSKTPIDKKDFNLKSFKNTENLTQIKDKDLNWFNLSDAFYEITKLPGIPKGYFTIVRGFPNTGKSTIKLELIKSCQENGVLPVIIETENNFSWEHAKLIGVEFEDIYGDVVDEETGELINKVIDHDGFFLYFDSDTLYRKYGHIDHSNGKELTKPSRDVACIEDVAYCINDLLKKQMDGELPYELCFIWDSVGTLSSYKSLLSKVGNNMFDAGAYSSAFSSIVNDKIPSSRKETRQYTNTFFCVNKIWKNSMVYGAAVVENKGGNTLGYAARLVIHLGGVETPGVSKLKATKGGKNYYYGVETKIRVEKNHVNNLTYEGTICSVPHGLVNPSKLEQYKKEHMKYLLEQLETTDESDINFSQETE